MKKFYSLIFMSSKLKLICAIGALVLMVASCSKSSDSGLLNRIPADAKLAAVINVKNFVESAGGKVENDKITLPAYVQEETDETDMKLNDCGLKLDNVGFWVDEEESVAMELFEIDNPDKLLAYLGKDGFEKESTEGDYEFYYRTTANSRSILYPSCVITDGYAYFYDRHVELKSGIVNIIEHALSKPMADTAAGAYAAEGNGFGLVMNMSSVESAAAGMMTSNLIIPLKGQLCMKGDLGKDEAVVRSILMDENGKRVKPTAEDLKFDTQATVSDEALAYLPSNECMVYSVALKGVDWDAAIDGISRQTRLNPMQKMMMGMVKEYLKKIDGTVAIGVGFEGTKEDIASICNGASPLGYMPVTIAIQTVAGQEKGFLGDIEAILGTIGLNVNTLGDGFSAKLPEDLGMIYGKEEKNMIVLSNRPIEKYDDNVGVKNADLSRYFGGLVVYLPADYPLMKSLGLNENVLLTSVADLKEGEGIGRLKITGDTQGQIVERALRTLSVFKQGFEHFEAECDIEDDFTPLDGIE